MEKRVLATMLGLLFLSMGAPIPSVHTQIVASYNNPTDVAQTLDMLIFISPQYADDKEIKTSINSYMKAVKDDLGWNTKLIPIHPELNQYQKIDQKIEQHYSIHPIKACIMVGEDLDTALAGDCNYMEKPSTIPWSTVGGTNAYNTSKQGVISEPYTTKICISLLYPTHALEYQTKKSQIMCAFTKFSMERHSHYLKEMLVLESSDINKNSKQLYQKLHSYGNLDYQEDPVDLQLNKDYSLYLVHGHSNPSGTDINGNKTQWFSADNLDRLDTPFFGADGCYVNGWWSQQLDNNLLDQSIDVTWYGSKIFTSETIQAMALGLLSQNGFSYPVSFIQNALPDLLEGKTLAESMIGDAYGDNTIIIGDPTFHYTL